MLEIDAEQTLGRHLLIFSAELLRDAGTDATEQRGHCRVDEVVAGTELDRPTNVVVLEVIVVCTRSREETPRCISEIPIVARLSGSVLLAQLGIVLSPTKRAAQQWTN